MWMERVISKKQLLIFKKIMYIDIFTHMQILHTALEIQNMVTIM